MTDFNMELCPIFSKMSENDIPDFGFELLTVVESQILRAFEIQRWYKNSGFSRFSNYRQSLKMTSYCQPDLANGKELKELRS